MFKTFLAILLEIAYNSFYDCLHNFWWVSKIFKGTLYQYYGNFIQVLTSSKKLLQYFVDFALFKILFKRLKSLINVININIFEFLHTFY